MLPHHSAIEGEDGGKGEERVRVWRGRRSLEREQLLPHHSAIEWEDGGKGEERVRVWRGREGGIRRDT